MTEKSDRGSSARMTKADWRRRTFGTALLGCVLACLSAVAGCGGSNPTTIVGNPTGVASLPAPPAPSASNVYVGSQGPGVWSLSLNDSANTFSYQPVTFPDSPNTPVTGTTSPANGFLRLQSTSGGSGYALEVQGRLAMLRPGDTTAQLVVGVPQTTCYPIPYRLRFEFVGMQAGISSDAVASPLAYGSFVANTDSSGASWQFQNLQGNAPFGPAIFSGSCASASGQTSIALSGVGVINQYNYGSSIFDSLTNITTTFTMGPTGIFVIDQSNPTYDPSQGQVAGSASAGVAQPSAPLTTSSVAAGNYLGFLTEGATSGNNPYPALTSPLAFMQANSSGTTMTGGDFPNDDVTQAPNSDIVINLGAQDSTINGFYSAVKVTTLDPNQNCATYLGEGANVPVTPGVNAQGYITCTYPAVAVVGNPEGKYVVFLDTYNYTANQLGAPMQIYLYQQ